MFWGQKYEEHLTNDFEKLQPVRTCVLEQCEEKIFLDGIFAGMLTYAEYIMQNVGLDEAQAGIKIAGRNINNLRHRDDTTFMTESQLKSLLMKVKEESEKAGLELNTQ